MAYKIETLEGWQSWVTPRPLADKPIHRWFVFPHSFTSELVHALIAEWGLKPTDRILDPFCGAGTTLLAAKEKGIPASGYDLSPLAVFVSRTKLSNYRTRHLSAVWKELQSALEPESWNGASKEYPDLVKKALPGRLLGAFDAIANEINYLDCSKAERDFFRLALLDILPDYSHAVASGGWLSWVDKRKNARSLPSALEMRVQQMLNDLDTLALPRRAEWRANVADARCLPDRASTYSAVITSPPYPNRHDYTRVFGVELMFGFLDWGGTRQLRYQSFHSHPEARPERPVATNYAQPRRLSLAIGRLNKAKSDPRIAPMLQGYFLDMYICLREVSRVCKHGAHVAFVIGNAQYNGVPIPVDLLTAEIGEQVDLTCKRIWTARYRGNSAQQMEKYGRNPSRESIVIFHKP